MFLTHVLPGDFLKPYIRFYRIIHFDFRNSPGPENRVKYYRPRVEHCLQFTPFDRERVDYEDKKTICQSAAVFGQQTVLSQRSLGDHFLNFQVVFQPGAFTSLFRASADEFTNQYRDARDVLGTEVVGINEQLAACTSYDAMVKTVERYLSRLVNRTRWKIHPVSAIAAEFQYLQPVRSLEWYANQANLSFRQFDRTFKYLTGIAPKDYRNLVRLDHAYLLKNRDPGKDGLSIALESGFYDYQHLAKVYKRYTGYGPGEFYKLEKRAPERNFGHYEK